MNHLAKHSVSTRRIAILAVIAAMCCSLSRVHAQDEPDLADTFGPHVVYSAAVVVVVEPARIDVEAWWKQVDDMIVGRLTPELAAPMRGEHVAQAKAVAADWLKRYHEAGGRELAFILTTELTPGRRGGIAHPNFVLAIRTEAKADHDALAGMLSPMLEGIAVQTSSEAGMLRIVTKDLLEEDDAQDPPGDAGRTEELRKVLAMVPDASVRIALVPPTYVYRVVGEGLGGMKLPPPFDDATPAVIVRGVWQAALSLSVAPALDAQLVIKSSDAEAATRFEALAEKALAVASEELAEDLTRTGWPNDDPRRDPEATRKVQATLTEVMKLIQPKADGDTLAVHLTGEHVAKTVEAIALPLSRAREQAHSLFEMSNMRQLTIAAASYAADHDDTYPPDLATLVMSKLIQPRLLLGRTPSAEALKPLGRNVTFPDWTHEQVHAWCADHSAVLYVPGVDIKARNIGSAPLMFGRKPTRSGYVIAVYADGHAAQHTLAEWNTILRKQTGVNYKAWQDAPFGKLPEGAFSPAREPKAQDQ